jgi:hypothetical protein
MQDGKISLRRMSNRWLLLIVFLGIPAGLIFGVLAGSLSAKPALNLNSNAVELASPEQDDFIIMVAEAYSGDRDLKLADDRLARLRDERIASRVEKLASSYAPQGDLIASRLALLAVAMGSKDLTLLALSATPTDTATDTPTNTATATSTATPTSTPTYTPTFLPTPTPFSTDTPTLRPPTKVPTARPPAATSTFTPAPAPSTVWEPGDRSRWPGGVYFAPANVAPGRGYWHLVKATYCDAFNNSNPHQHDFGCDEMPGGPAGTNIYVMTGGASIDVIQPDGTNVGGNPSIVGDKKSPNDMCNCTYSFIDSNFRISVAGAPSDAIGGFCLCSVNFGWGSHAHVRYFLYFQYVTR